LNWVGGVFAQALGALTIDESSNDIATVIVLTLASVSDGGSYRDQGRNASGRALSAFEILTNTAINVVGVDGLAGARQIGQTRSEVFECDCGCILQDEQDGDEQHRWVIHDV
jgi:hypothetical protein